LKCDMSHIPTIGLIGILRHRCEQRAKEMFGKYDLNKTHANILFSLHQSQSLSQKELAERLNVTPPSITSAIQKMEKAGYISRKADEKDQRIMRLELAQRGRDCIENVKKVAQQLDEMMFQGMSTEEKLLMRRMLLQVCENLAEER
jgi:DNA-binding MarR family transcriptional regulator